MFTGIPNDVNNTISGMDVYASWNYPTNIGAPDSTRTQTAPNNDTPSTGASNNTLAAAESIPGKPAHWWISFLLVFIGFVFISRKYGNDSFSNIRMSVYNGLFLTFFIVLMLNMMKVIAAKLPPNPVSALVLAA